MQCGVSWFAAMSVSGILREQIDEVTPIRAHPCPQLAGLWMLRLAEMAEVLVHRRHALAQLQRKAVQEVIVGGDALHYGLGAAQQDVTAQFVQHAASLRR